MANWAHVQNNEIKELHDFLPKSWKNISGLRLSENDTEFLKSLGWYKIEKTNDYNSSMYVIQSFEYKYVDGKVIETLVLIERPQSPTKSKSEFLDELRLVRNEKLKESDWTQLIDCPLSKSEVKRWSVYRQYLRDLPELYESNGVLFLDEVQWPDLNNIEVPLDTFEEN